MEDTIQYLNVTDNIRIKRSDDKNVEVEIKRMVKSKPNRYQTEHKETEKWTFGGFYSNVFQALSKIVSMESTYAIGAGTAKEIKNLLSVVESLDASIRKSVADADLTVESFTKQQDNRGRKKDTLSVKVVEVKDKFDMSSEEFELIPATK